MIKQNTTYNEIFTAICGHIENAINSKQQPIHCNNIYKLFEADPETDISNPLKPDSSLKRSIPVKPKESINQILHIKLIFV